MAVIMSESGLTHCGPSHGKIRTIHGRGRVRISLPSPVQWFWMGASPPWLGPEAMDRKRGPFRAGQTDPGRSLCRLHVSGHRDTCVLGIPQIPRPCLLFPKNLASWWALYLQRTKSPREKSPLSCRAHVAVDSQVSCSCHVCWTDGFAKPFRDCGPCFQWGLRS